MRKILIIDSGVVNHPKLKNINIQTTGFKKQNRINDIWDNIGHGTAITELVSKDLDRDKVVYFIIKLFDKEMECNMSNLIECLEYVSRHNEYDVINMSFGITASETSDEIRQVYKLCKTIQKQGTIIVSAYDNDGAVSYPAFFDCVIGVETSQKANRRNEYEYVRNSCVNVLGYGKNQKVAWNIPQYTIIEGNSFACANVTNVIARMMVEGCDTEEVNKRLEEDAIGTIKYGRYVRPPKRPQWLKGCRAITFPFNKEIQSLYAYEDLLDFKLVNAYDVKYKALIGRDISKILNYRDLTERIIENYEKVKWESDNFDTIIVGHVGELSNICKRDFLKEIVFNCCTYGKRIYALDDLSRYSVIFKEKDANNSFFYPRIGHKNIPKGRFGKLFNIQIPVLGILGTSSSQGKYTIQLSIRKKLTEANYKVGQIGTEPTAYCFNMDFSYPYGYNSTVYTNGYHNIQILNQAIHDIEMKGCDICVVGSQTNTALYGYSNLKNLPLFQAEFLYGTMPDAFILVVNAHDSIEYIERTIKSTEELIESSCIAIVIYPMMKKPAIGSLYKAVKIPPNEFFQLKEEIEKETKVPVFSFEEAMEEDVILDKIIDFFSEKD